MGERYGPPWSSSNDSPSPGRDAAEQDEEDSSPSGNKLWVGLSRPPGKRVGLTGDASHLGGPGGICLVE